MSIPVWYQTAGPESEYLGGFVSHNCFDEPLQPTARVFSNASLSGHSQQVPMGSVFRQNERSCIQAAQDMTALRFLEEPNMLHCLRTRYDHGHVYTAIAGVLVAVNPYRQIKDLYSTTCIHGYKVAPYVPVTKPHVFRIAESSFRGLTRYGQNQSVICCGESGSGKTESTKMLLRYLTTSNNTKGKIEQQVLQTNVITEAFGNSQTKMNYNSSRFAKFIKLFVGGDGVQDAQKKVSGCHTETYLLERTRIVSPPVHERNFHIFYQLCAAATAKGSASVDLSGFHLVSSEKFHYLCKFGTAKSPVTIKGVSDCDLFQDLVDALGTLQFSQSEQHSVFQVVAAVLHLGQFDPDHIGSERSNKALRIASELLGLDSAQLKKNIVTRAIHVGSEESYTKDQTEYETEMTRDALAKVIYTNLFNWTIQKINTTCTHTQANQNGWIGILDVFGFECFEHNSFEQFCINFANEQLQNYFNDCILQSEQEEYKKEAIRWKDIPLPDNTGTVQLFHAKPSGIFSLLDSACILPSGTSEQFVDSVFTIHKNHASLKPLALPRSVKRYLGFTVCHYAGRVKYNTEQFMAKNDDSLHPDSLSLLAQSTNELVRQLFGGTNGHDKPNRNGRGVRRFHSISRTFTSQVDQLMKELKSTKSYFVRCINPNSEMKASLFSWDYVQPQTRCGGLVETLRMLKYGYPFRVPYTLITDHFLSKLGFSEERQKTTKIRNLCEAILFSIDATSFKTDADKDYQLGLTKIFFRAGKQDLLEKVEDYAKGPLSATFKRSVVAWLIKRRWDCVRGVVKFRMRSNRLLRRVRTLRALRKHVRVVVCVQKFVAKCRYKAGLAKQKKRVFEKPPSKPKEDAEEKKRHASEKQALKDAIDRAERDKKALEKQAEALLREKNEALERAQESARAREQAIDSQLKQTQDHLERLARKEADLTEQLRVKDAFYEEKQQEVLAAQEKERELREELASKIAEFEEKQRELEELAEQDLELRRQLQSKTSQFEQTQREFQQTVESQKQELVQIQERLQATQRAQEAELAVVRQRARDISKSLKERQQEKVQQALAVFQTELDSIKDVYERQLELDKQIAVEFQGALTKRDKLIEELKQNERRMMTENAHVVEDMRAYMTRQIQQMKRHREEVRRDQKKPKVFTSSSCSATHTVPVVKPQVCDVFVRMQRDRQSRISSRHTEERMSRLRRSAIIQ